MRIRKIVARGIRGRSFDEEVGPVHVFVGANGAGKSTRLLACEIALAGAGKSERRVGSEEVMQVGVQIEVASAVSADGVVSITRTLAPKPQLIVAPFSGPAAALAAKLDGLLGVPVTTFRIGEFIDASDDKQRAALLRLAAPTDVKAYQAIAPDVPAFDGESASAWIERALKVKTDELAAHREKKRTAKTVTVGLANAAQGQAENVDALKAERAAIEAERDGRNRAATHAAAASVRDDARGRLDALQEPVAVDAAPIDLQPLRDALAGLQGRQRAADVAKRAYDDLLAIYSRAGEELALVEQRQQAVKSLILSIAEAFGVGANAGTFEDLNLLQVELDEHGYPARGPLVREMQDSAAKASQLVAVAAPSAVEMANASSAIDAAVASNATLNQRRMEVARAKDARSAASIAVGKAQAAVDRAGTPPPRQMSETDDELGERLVALNARIIEAAKATATEQTEFRLLGTADEADKKIDGVKRTIADLKDGLDRCLRVSLAPVAETMDPLLGTFGARFTIGADAPLGFERDGRFIPIEAASRSEQAIYAAGLALAFASREPGKLRLVMFDDLDACDERRVPCVLAAAARLVEAGRLDNVLATTCHPVTACDGVTISDV